MSEKQFTISLFDNKFATAPREKSCTWSGFMVSFQHPRVRAAKDGTLFSPCTFVPAAHTHKHRKQNCPCGIQPCVPESLYPCEKACRNLNCCESLSMLVLDCDHDASLDAIESTLLKLGCTYAIYSTHSHRRVTDSNPQAENRYRVVIPLADPIPATEFPNLWQWAKQLHGLTVDESAKDPSRMYYTPAVASNDKSKAPYQYRGNIGELLSWRQVLNQDSPALASVRPLSQHSAVVENGSQRTAHVSAACETSPSDFIWHEDRHEELMRRVAARGKENGRGNIDARCLAHGGKGKTALCCFPATKAVKCNRGCSYQAILAAEGLSTLPLPSKEAAAVRERRAALQLAAATERRDFSGRQTHKPRVLKLADLHQVYSVLLAHLLVITPHDEAQIKQVWGCEAYGTMMIDWPEPDGVQLPLKTCSAPSPLESVVAANKLAEWFNLDGVPGFYRDVRALPASPTQHSQRERWLTKEFGEWRLNVPAAAAKSGLLVPYDNGTGYIVGIRIYRNVRDRVPTLLTSRGLPGGAKAIAVREAVAA